MKFRLTMPAVCLLFLSVLAEAQQAPPANAPTSPPNPRDAIKSILDLSDQQLQQLTELQNTFFQRTRDLGNQIRTLEQKKRELLQATNPDVTQLGSLLIQEQNLQKQMQDSVKSYHDAAVTLLTSTQKQKVSQIQEAVKLAPQSGPLAAFGLMEAPGPGPQPFPGAFIRAFRGPGMGGAGVFEDVQFFRGIGPVEAGPLPFFNVPVGPPPGIGPRP